jgi:hypothetical protein
MNRMKTRVLSRAAKSLWISSTMAIRTSPFTQSPLLTAEAPSSSHECSDRVGQSCAQICIPSYQEGSCCQRCTTAWSQSVLHQVYPNQLSTLTSNNASVEVEVFKRVCICGAYIPYDGREDGIFNLSNLSLFTYECLLR